MKTKLTQYEIDRNKAISKVQCIIEQYFGIFYLNNDDFRAKFTRMISTAIDFLLQQLETIINIASSFSMISHLPALNYMQSIKLIDIRDVYFSPFRLQNEFVSFASIRRRS